MHCRQKTTPRCGKTRRIREPQFERGFEGRLLDGDERVVGKCTVLSFDGKTSTLIVRVTMRVRPPKKSDMDRVRQRRQDAKATIKGLSKRWNEVGWEKMPKEDWETLQEAYNILAQTEEPRRRYTRVERISVEQFQPHETEEPRFGIVPKTERDMMRMYNLLRRIFEETSRSWGRKFLRPKKLLKRLKKETGINFSSIRDAERRMLHLARILRSKKSKRKYRQK